MGKDNGNAQRALYKGNVEITGRESSDSLFVPELRSIKKGGFDQRKSTDAVKMFSLTYQLFGERRK